MDDEPLGGMFALGQQDDENAGEGTSDEEMGVLIAELLGGLA